jgi:hypothetical protein
MKKITLAFLFVILVSNAFAQNTPAGHLWGYSETDGYCIVDGQRLHYWLYSTDDGETRQLIRAFVSYVERRGWTVDYDNYQEIFFNDELADSVRSMMIAKNADVSMTIIEHNRNRATLVVNDCLVNENGSRIWDICRSRFYPLVK